MPSKAQREAIQRMKDAKSGKVNQLDMLDDDDEAQEEVYEMMTEKEYDAHRRRNQTSGFVVDDDGLGYADDGQDLEDDEDEDEEDERAGRGGAEDEARRRRRMLQRMSGAGSLQSFFGAATGSHGPSSGSSRFAAATAVVQSAAGVVKAASSGAGSSSSGRVGGTKDLSDMLGELDDDAGMGLGGAAAMEDEDEDEEELGLADEAGSRGDAQTGAAGQKGEAEAGDEQPDRKKARVEGAAAGGRSRASLRASLKTGLLAKKKGAAPSALRKQREAEIAASASDKRSVAAVTAASAKRGWLGGGAGAASGGAAAGGAAADAKAAEGLPLVRGSFPRPIGAKKSSEPFYQDEMAMPFFLVDAYEEKADPGSVYLFGKCPNPANPSAGQGPAVNGPVRPCPPLVSCCVIVRGMRRTMFVQPRGTHADTGDAVGFMDVYQEVSRRLKQSLSRDAEFKVKKVQRSYAFELPDIPRGKSDFLKLVYPATERALEPTMQGKTFRRVFGTNTTSLEHFLIKRKIKGPCWLAIRKPKAVTARKSWCVCEAVVDTPKAIDVLEGDCPALLPAHALMRTWAPPASAGNDAPASASAPSPAAAAVHAPTLPTPALVVLALSIKTVVNPRTHTHELVAVSGILHRSVPITGPMEEDTKVLEPFCVVCPPATGGKLPADLVEALKKTPPHVQQAVRRTPNERALLNFTLSRLAAMDPDVLMGHGLQGFALDVLLHRMQAHKLRTWSRIGRINRSRMPQTSKGADGRETFTGTLAAGRLVCDTSVIGRELMQKETSYALTPLVRSQLGEERQDIEPLQVPFFFSSGESLVGLLQHSLQDSWLAFRLANRMQALPLTRQISNLAGNLWSQTLLSKRSQRVEFLLLHEFHRLKFVVPDRWGPNSSAIGKGGKGKGGKGGGKSTSKRKKPQYAGGLVLEPKKGLYDKFVLLLDFNSLYPSIIQEYNICYTTILREHEAAEQGGGASAMAGAGGTVEDDMEAIAAAAAGELGSGAAAASGAGSSSGSKAGDGVYMPPIPDSTEHPEPGVLPRMISGLVNRRRAVKKELKKAKDPVSKQQLDIQQFALKILANSMYGCLGFSNSRFFAQPIAALVTSQGREILQSTKELAEGKLGMKVIYGDTDSIMVLTNSTDIKEVRGLGKDVIRAVNKQYRQVELDIDGIYARMLLLKKKKYAALTVEGTETGQDGQVKLKLKREIKGLDMVRRDWCVLSKRIGEQVLDMLLEAGTDTEGAVDQLHELMTTLAKDMREGNIPLEKYVITKGLNKRATEYPDPTSMPHVMVAMAMMRRGRHVSVGDHIPYVIAMDNPDAPAAPASGSGAASDGQAPMQGGAKAASSSSSSSSAAAGGSPVPSSSSSGVPVSTPPKQPANSATAAAQVVADATQAAAGQKSAAAASSAGKKKGAALRAHHPDDVTESEGRLVPDVEWYLVSQILPVISRLVEPIEGVSQQSLAAALGIEHAVKSHGQSGGYGGDYDQDGYVPSAVLDDETRFSGADRLPVCCMRCKYACDFAGVRYSADALEAAGKAAGRQPLPVHAVCGLQCPVPGCGGLVVSAQTASASDESFGVPAFLGVQTPGSELTGEEIDECRASIGNALALSARDCVRSHMAGWQSCDEPSCGARTRQMAVRKGGCECLREGCRGRLWPEMPFAKLHNQLEYFESLANVDASAHRARVAEVAFPRIHPELADVYASALAMVRRRLQQSAYHFVNPSIFSYVGTLKLGDDVERKRQVAGLEGDMDGPVVAY